MTYYVYISFRNSSNIQAVIINTPQVGPIDHDPSHILLTPITSGLIRQQIQDIMEDFILDNKNPYLTDTQNKIKHKKPEHINNQEKYLFKIDCQLENIFEDSCEYSNFSSSSSSSKDYMCDEQSNECYVDGNFIKWKSKDTQDQQKQNEEAIQFPNTEYLQKIDLFKKYPKAELIKKLRQIEHKDQDESNKKMMIKKALQNYIVEYEVYCFEEAWIQLPTTVAEIIQIVLKGVGQLFAQKIGSISYEARRVKLLTYLEKKKRRKWRKKVSYDCRKRVADGRLRIKGKFVTRQQICKQLGFENLDFYTAEQIKELMENRTDQNGNEQTVF